MPPSYGLFMVDNQVICNVNAKSYGNDKYENKSFWYGYIRRQFPKASPWYSPYIFAYLDICNRNIQIYSIFLVHFKSVWFHNTSFRKIIAWEEPPVTSVTWYPPGQNGRQFADGIFKCISMNGNFCISFHISLKFAPKGPIDNKSALD